MNGVEPTIMMKSLQPGITHGQYVSNKYFFKIKVEYPGLCSENIVSVHPLTVVPVVNPQFFGFDLF